MKWIFVILLVIALYEPKVKIISPMHILTEAELHTMPSLIKHEFEIVNVGTSQLVIESVESSCSCTSVVFDQTIAPLDTGKISLETSKEQLLNVKEVYAVLKTNAAFKFAKVQIKVK